MGLNMKNETIQSWQETSKIMQEHFGVTLPEEEKLITVDPSLALPTLFVISELTGVNASYLTPNIDAQTNVEERELGFTIPDEVLHLCKNVQTVGGRALLVGGIIRDVVLSDFTGTTPKPKDFDIEVYGLDVPTVQAVLTKTFPKSKIDSVSKSFGVIKVYIDGFAEPLDVSVTRTDVSTGPGHKDFKTVTNPSMNYKVASRRRDLKMNALSYDPLLKSLYDPFLGKLDLQSKQISITDNETFIEDPLRVLRIMQFTARFEMQPTPETVALCTKMVADGLLDTLAAERVRDELLKMLLKSNRPSVGLEFAREIGFIEKYWLEFFALIGTPQHQLFHPEGDAWVHTLQTLDAAALIAERENLSDDRRLVLMLTMLCHDLGKPATTELKDGYYRAFGHEAAGLEPTRRFLNRLKIDNATKMQVEALVPKHMQLGGVFKQEFPREPSSTATSFDSATTLRKMARKLATEAGLPLNFLMLVTEADYRGRNGNENTPLEEDDLQDLVKMKRWFSQKTAEYDIATKVAKPLLSNKELLKSLNKKGGEWIGVIAKCVLLDQDEGAVTTEEEALQQAKKYFAATETYFHSTHEKSEDFTTRRHMEFCLALLLLEDPREVLALHAARLAETSFE